MPMKVEEWLAFFQSYPEKKLFTLADLVQLTGEDKASLSVQLTRLIQGNVIQRAARQWYKNPFNPPSREEVAMALRPPAYLSLEYALSKHGILSQAAYVLTLATTRSPYTYQTAEATYEYHQIRRTLFWGYTQENNVALAEPEKALLDLVYIRQVMTRELRQPALASLIEDMDLTALHENRLHQYAQRFPPQTTTAIHRLLPSTI